jgi:uncharacterized protein (UPF0332 family)
MSTPPTKAPVADEWRKAERALAAAERNADANDHETAANRLYYAALHSAKAVLLTEGIEPRRHRAVGRLLVVHFISRDLLPDWIEPALSRLETERDLADYAADYRVTEGRYAKCREEAARLMPELERFLRSGGWLDPDD